MAYKHPDIVDACVGRLKETGGKMKTTRIIPSCTVLIALLMAYGVARAAPSTTAATTPATQMVSPELKLPPSAAHSKKKHVKHHAFNPHVESKIAGGREVGAARARDMSLPRNKYPGIRFPSAKKFFAKNRARNKTAPGLYILDSDIIPRNLPEILKSQGIRLNRHGIPIGSKGEKMTVLLWPKLISVNAKQGMRSPNDWLQRLGIISTAHAASPYPLRWVSAWASWSLPSGFCRTVRADTGADAWGPLQGGDRPHTRIQYIETRAQVAHYRRNSCYNCDTQHSRDEWNVGCFWPAYSASGYHYANLKDGSFSWSWRYVW